MWIRLGIEAIVCYLKASIGMMTIGALYFFEVIIWIIFEFFVSLPTVLLTKMHSDTNRL